MRRERGGCRISQERKRQKKREKARVSAGEEECRECMRKLCQSAEEEEQEEGVWRKREEVIYRDFEGRK